MGVVILFEDIRRTRQPASAGQGAGAGDFERAIARAIGAAVDHSGVLAAARPLLDLCRDRYGFVVMSDGLAQDPAILGRALLELFRGLAMLDTAMSAPRSYPTFGVYFGRRQLAWFEDGYSGAAALAVPDNIVAAALTAFVAPRVVRQRSHSQE